MSKCHIAGKHVSRLLWYFRFIFWSDISDYPKIERASLTGQNREVIISKGLAFPVAIDVDVSGTSRRIYWVDTVRDTVESALLDGGDRRIVRRMAHTEFFDLALYRVYFSIIILRFVTMTALFSP